jgi:hypothetical protein
VHFFLPGPTAPGDGVLPLMGTADQTVISFADALQICLELQHRRAAS